MPHGRHAALGQVGRGNVGLTSVEALAARSISERRRLLQRYALAGAAFSVVLTRATLMAESIPVTPVRLLAVPVLYMWPLTVTAAVIAGFEWPW